MKEVTVTLNAEQEAQLNQMVQETGLSEDRIVNSAINELYRNYSAWRRRLSLK